MNLCYLVPPRFFWKGTFVIKGTCFYRRDVLPVTRTTVSEHWRKLEALMPYQQLNFVLSWSSDCLLMDGIQHPLHQLSRCQYQVQYWVIGACSACCCSWSSHEAAMMHHHLWCGSCAVCVQDLVWLIHYETRAWWSVRAPAGPDICRKWRDCPRIHATRQTVPRFQQQQNGSYPLVVWWFFSVFYVVCTAGYWHQRSVSDAPSLRSLVVDEDRLRPMDDVLSWDVCFELPSVLWHCRLGDRKGIWPVKSCATYLRSFFPEQVEEEDQSGNWLTQAYLDNSCDTTSHIAQHFYVCIVVFFCRSCS